MQQICRYSVVLDAATKTPDQSQRRTASSMVASTLWYDKGKAWHTEPVTQARRTVATQADSPDKSAAPALASSVPNHPEKIAKSQVPAPPHFIKTTAARLVPDRGGAHCAASACKKPRNKLRCCGQSTDLATLLFLPVPYGWCLGA
jgi:hypothetical protein